jgi:steroid delta-isomerase-like uncharacterized protein
MSTEENKILARRLSEEVYSRGNLDAADEIYAPDFVGHDPNSPEEMRSPEGVKQLAGAYRNAFPDLQVTIEDQVAEGDEVATRWRARGTHQGEMMGIAPTGNRVEMTGINFSRIAEGKIVEEWYNYDALGLMQQLGVVPPPGQAGS